MSQNRVTNQTKWKINAPNNLRLELEMGKGDQLRPLDGSEKMSTTW